MTYPTKCDHRECDVALSAQYAIDRGVDLTNGEQAIREMMADPCGYRLCIDCADIHREGQKCPMTGRVKT